MNPLIIVLMSLAVLILLFTLLLFLPVRLALSFDKKVRLWLRVLCFSFPLYPRNKKWRIKDHLPKHRQKKKHKHKKNVQIRDEHKTSRGNQSRIEKIKCQYFKITDLLNTVVFPAAERLGSKLTVKISRLELSIGTDDAAKTALLYAAAVNGGYALLSFIDEHTNLKQVNNGKIGVLCRYDRDKTILCCDLEIGISLYGALYTILPALLTYLQQETNGDL